MDDILLKNLNKPAEFLVVVFVVYLVVEILQLPKEPTNIDRMARHLVQILLTFNLAWFCYNMVSLLEHWLPIGPKRQSLHWMINWFLSSERHCAYSSSFLRF